MEFRGRLLLGGVPVVVDEMMERMGKHSSAEFDRIQRETLRKWDADEQSLSAYDTIEGFCKSRCLERGAWTKDQMDACLSVCTDDITNLDEAWAADFLAGLASTWD